MMKEHLITIAAITGSLALLYYFNSLKKNKKKTPKKKSNNDETTKTEPVLEDKKLESVPESPVPEIQNDWSCEEEILSHVIPQTEETLSQIEEIKEAICLIENNKSQDISNSCENNVISFKYKDNKESIQVSPIENECLDKCDETNDNMLEKPVSEITIDKDDIQPEETKDTTEEESQGETTESENVDDISNIDRPEERKVIAEKVINIEDFGGKKLINEDSTTASNKEVSKEETICAESLEIPKPRSKKKKKDRKGKKTESLDLGSKSTDNDNKNQPMKNDKYDEDYWTAKKQPKASTSNTSPVESTSDLDREASPEHETGTSDSHSLVINVKFILPRSFDISILFFRDLLTVVREVLRLITKLQTMATFTTNQVLMVTNIFIINLK